MEAGSALHSPNQAVWVLQLAMSGGQGRKHGAMPNKDLKGSARGFATQNWGGKASGIRHRAGGTAIGSEKHRGLLILRRSSARAGGRRLAEGRSTHLQADELGSSPLISMH